MGGYDYEDKSRFDAAHEEGSPPFSPTPEAGGPRAAGWIIGLGNALTQARALLQKARPLLNMIADDLARPADEAVRAEIDAFLARLPAAETLCAFTRVPLAFGALVRPEHEAEHDKGNDDGNERRVLSGVKGRVSKVSKDGAEISVITYDGRSAWWHPDELTPEPDGPALRYIPYTAVFAPTPEEVAMCPMLAEVAGKPEREAVMYLAGRYTEARQDLSDGQGGSRVLAERLLAKVEAERTAPRPRIGPWVAAVRMSTQGRYWARYDATGREVGVAWAAGADRGWWGRADRPFADPVGIEEDGASKEQAQAAVDAVLATWADLDVVPAADALMRARTLLQRALLALRKIAPRFEADVLGGPTWQEVDALSPDVATFLAGLPAVNRATAPPMASLRYQARAQRSDGPFENVGEPASFREAKRLALAAQERRGGHVFIEDEQCAVVWESPASPPVPRFCSRCGSSLSLEPGDPCAICRRKLAGVGFFGDQAAADATLAGQHIALAPETEDEK